MINESIFNKYDIIYICVFIKCIYIFPNKILFKIHFLYAKQHIFIFI